ncbi:MAG: RNA polymerase sigma factor [Saprospiraceae bacterium]|nr:MAG: RNA polymerase sigma factor [Saprospiraceae bacterium]
MEVVAKNVLSKKAHADYELVKKAVKGDQRAYASLMNRYQASIFHLMLKMVNDREDANDLTIEAFGKAFLKLPSYVPRYAFSTWLFKIAINNCIDYVRKKRMLTYSIDDPIEPDSEQDYRSSLRAKVLNPEEEVIRKQRVKLMRRVLTKLSNKYRLMIELRFFEELSYEEISNELNIPLGTVKAQLFRAKEMLYELLQQPGASAYLETTRRRTGTA